MKRTPQPTDCIRDYMGQLMEWTNSCGFEEIYNNTSGKRQARTAKELNATIDGKDRLLFIIVSNKGNVFGSYNSTKIQPDTGAVWDDPNHFVFTLQNQMNIRPRIYKRRVEGMWPTLCLWNDVNAENVVTIPGLCDVSNALKPNFVYKNFGNIYQDDGDGFEVFCNGEIRLEKRSNGAFTSLNSLVVFQMKPFGNFLRVKAFNNANVNMGEVIKKMNQFGRCHVDSAGNSFVVKFENANDAERCFKERENVMKDGLNVQIMK
ncbi:hypothetical protein EIN_408660 [Entamoeba invadens IP1]|uniref:TLDc domain-containing protein n=1 Tax=Entamoeba invadens IP1 TaxID=370355 RepID=A0A0A1TWN4_ENTIV|nr:hypothetical protein EIN_408660 [Entamoeba invadens IP1]ELP85597.1 hypothetical protein EIN_408660 [Entamoeba invadens IP1]|eukprot:XP_004184943.1 hypothetical protein EIN_408660 [Entamoeba invadens IP1]